MDAEDEESVQAGDAAHNDDEEDGGAVPVAMTKKKHKKRRGESQAGQNARARAKRRGGQGDATPETRDEQTTRS